MTLLGSTVDSNSSRKHEWIILLKVWRGKKCYNNGLLVRSQELQKEGNVANPTKVQPKSFFHLKAAFLGAFNPVSIQPDYKIGHS